MANWPAGSASSRTRTESAYSCTPPPLFFFFLKKKKKKKKHIPGPLDLEGRGGMAGTLVLVNGRLWSADGVGAGCDAIVVGDGRISAVTRSAGARAGGPRARDRPEGTPGHPGVRRRARPSRWWRPREPPLQSRRPAQPPRVPRHLAEYARTLGPDDWVLGGGWSLEAFPGGIRPPPTCAAARPSRLPAEPRPSQRLGQPGSARPGRDHPDTPIPRRPDRTRRAG